MELQFLGVGSGLNTHLGNTNALVNKKILIDCGSTAPNNLGEIGCLRSVTDIFITHLHGDHCYGLEILGFLNYFVLKKSPRLWLSKDMARVLWEEVLKGTMKYLQSQGGGVKYAEFKDYYEIRYLEDCNFSATVDDITVKMFRTRHVPEKESYSIGLVENGVREMLYTSDINAPVFDYVKDAEKYRLIFHDCQLFETDSDIHVSINGLRKLPEELRKKIVLMHYGHDIDNEDTSMFKGVARKFGIYT
ncbi:MBL fold metallo-hydrolase [Candidatus Riflebacteria bacterium]